MTDREIVEWVAQVQVGEALPGVSYFEIARAMQEEAGFREPRPGESIVAWCQEAHDHARRVVDSETWRADALK